MTTYRIIAFWRYTETIRDGVYDQDELALIGIQVQNKDWDMLADADWEEAKDTTGMEPCILKTQYGAGAFEFSSDDIPEPSEFAQGHGLRIIHEPTQASLEDPDIEEELPEYELINGYQPTKNDTEWQLREEV